MSTALIVNLMDLAIIAMARSYRIETGHLSHYFHWEDLLSRHWILSLRFPIPIIVGRRGGKKPQVYRTEGLSEYGATD